MSTPNILVIGNGFDLYHNLKTNYIDFINFAMELRRQYEFNNSFINCFAEVANNSFINCFAEVATENQNWIDCEKEIEIIVTIIMRIMYDKNVFLANTNYIDKNESSLTSYEFVRLKLMNKFCKRISEKRIVFKDRYFKIYQGIDKNLVMETLKDDLNYLT